MKIMGEEGRKKVLEEYNWENESKNSSKLILSYNLNNFDYRK